MLIDFNHIQNLLALENVIKKYKKPWQQKIIQFAKEFLINDNLIKVETSGSTGHPKELNFTKKQLMTSAKMTGNYFKFSSERTLLLCLSPDYIAGKMMIARAIFWKMKLLCLKPVGNPLKNLKTKIFFTSLVPYQLEKIVNENPEKIRNISKILIGGAPINHNLFKQIKNSSTRFYESFGMSETLSHIAIKKLNGKNLQGYFSTLPGIKINTDKRGCLIINAPFLKKSVFTKDLVEIKDKQKFKWLGRCDNLINSGGVKLIPEILENKIKHLFNTPFYFTSLDEKKLGNELILVIEDKHNYIDKKLIFTQIEKHLDKYEIPKKIFKLKRFCKTHTGKIQRNKTLQKLLSLHFK